MRHRGASILLIFIAGVFGCEPPQGSPQHASSEPRPPPPPPPPSLASSAAIPSEPTELPINPVNNNNNPIELKSSSESGRAAEPMLPCPATALQPPGALAWASGNMIKIAKPIQFATAKDEILDVSLPVLDAVVNILLREESLRVEVAAHSDNRGSRNFNLELTQKRANAVKKYLIDKGVEEPRLTAKGYGDQRPISGNITGVGRTKNRRIEFIILCVN